MERRQRHILFGVVLLLGLIAGGAAGVVASITTSRILADYAATLLPRTPVTTGTTPRDASQSSDTAAAHVADVAEKSVATFTTTTLSSRSPASWVRAASGVGSGVVVSTDGWVLTTHDAVRAFGDMRTDADVWIDGVRYRVTQVVADTMTDFVLVHVDASMLTPVAFGASDAVENGTPLYAADGAGAVFVSSLVDRHSTAGVAVLPAEQVPYSWSLTVLPAKVTPVFGGSGDVLAFTNGEGALPLHVGNTFVQSVLRSGAPSYPGFGAYVVDLSLPLNIDTALAQDRREGALVLAPRAGVSAVLPSSPAALANITAGDVITAVDDVRVDRTHALGELILLYRPGDRATFSVLRDGVTSRVDVTFGTFEDLVY